MPLPPAPLPAGEFWWSLRGGMEPRLLVRQDDSEHGPRQPSFNISVGQLGVLLLLGSLAVVFIATIAAYLVTRSQAEVWHSQTSPEVNLGLAVGSVVLVALSASLQFALNSIRKNHERSLQQGLWTAFVLAVVFIVLQATNWSNLVASEGAMLSQSLYAFGFFTLTGVHALHVIGGLVPLGIVLYRARAREYSSSRVDGVRFCVQYWHFIGAVWFVLLAVILLST